MLGSEVFSSELQPIIKKAVAHIKKAAERVKNFFIQSIYLMECKVGRNIEFFEGANSFKKMIKISNEIIPVFHI
jgi:hypothetical protein